LQRVELVALGQTFDGEHVTPGSLDGQHQAGAHRVTVYENRTGAAHTVLTTQVGTGEPELGAKEVGQGDSYVGGRRARLAVDGEVD
jgi:hypothetical protein